MRLEITQKTVSGGQYPQSLMASSFIMCRVVLFHVSENSSL